MPGLRKAKEYDWKDSNMALVGSDTDREVKKASAETEEAWKGCGQEVGIQIWRINKFKVEHWPKEDYGKFFNGDSYIILNTYKNPDGDSLEYDLHFWVGKYSTSDEYGTAAYKTVELDTLLDDKPVQHREVMDHESELYKSYFPEMTILEGGVDTGFTHVEPVRKDPELFHFHGEKKNKITMKQVPLNIQNLDDSDVYILATPDMIYQWNGKGCSIKEKFTATQYCQQLKTGKVHSEVLDDGDVERDHPFFSYFSDDNPVEGKEVAQTTAHTEKLFKISDASGKMTFEKIAEGDITKSLFDTNDVFIYDKADGCYVWIGKGASVDERMHAMKYGENYLNGTSYPLKPIVCLGENREPSGFFNN